jgi:hypothetical protein
MGRFEREMSIAKTGVAVALASWALSDVENYGHAAGLRACDTQNQAAEQIKSCKDELPDRNPLGLAIIGLTGLAFGAVGAVGAALEYGREYSNKNSG